MTRDEIIRMAREACNGKQLEYFNGWGVVFDHNQLETFANLVAAAEREKWQWDDIHSCHPHCDRPACIAVRRAREDEREMCAQIAHDTYEGFGPHAKGVDYVKQSIMIRIRERGAP